MLKNYFKVALRYLLKHKGYTFINIAGLAVGIACCILIMLFVKSEWSFNRFHTKSERITRAWLEEYYQGEIFRNTVTPIPLVPVLQANIPEIEMSCRVAAMSPAIRHNNNVFNEQVNMVDSNFFKVFDFPFNGASNPFPSPNSLVITRSVSSKFFGTANPVGRTLDLQLGEERIIFNITAVADDPPFESTIQFRILIPFSNAKHVWSEKTRTSGWSNVSISSFFLLKEGTSLAALNQKIAAVMNPLVKETYKPGEYNIRMQPLHDIHFNTTLPDEVTGNSDPKYSYILGTIGILILLIACINFVTLSIGRSATRAREVGVRKVLGAARYQLVKQFWGEALIFTVLALITGLLISIALLKPFNQLANRELFLRADLFTIGFCFLIMIVIALIAGMYPAIVLSSFRPIQVLKGKITIGSRMGFFRKALVVGQFCASIIMIICTITIGKQLDYLQSKNLGFEKEHVILVPTNLPRKEGNKIASRFITEVQKNPQVIHATSSLYTMAHSGWMTMGYIDDQKVFRRFAFNAVDAAFIEAMGLKVIAGRGFQKNNSADSNVIVVNESLVKEYGWKDPIGQKLPGKYPQQVVGVVRDFHFESLHSPIGPALMALKPDSIFAHSSDVSYNSSPQPRISVRFREGNIKEHLNFLESAWKSVAADRDFNYDFLDELLAASYEQEKRMGNIVEYASILSIFIACMGLFGLATLVVVRRTKEIGIRKVLGADVSKIVTLISKDFVLLVLVSSLISFPLAWWALQKWLQDFAYRIDISWWVFVLAALMALLVALATVSIQAVKAAISNPVKSLRIE